MLASGTSNERRDGSATRVVTPRYRPPAWPAATADLRLALAAIAAVCRPDRRAGIVRAVVREGTLASRGELAGRDGAAAHARGARTDRRRHDLEPAGHGDRRRLRDVRLQAQPARTSGRAGVAEPRQCQRPQDQARD